MNLFSDADGYRVGTVFDHQFAYGFVTAGPLATPEFERCLRRGFNGLEYWITEQIQEALRAFPVSYEFTQLVTYSHS